jgi:hypothetical protein
MGKKALSPWTKLVQEKFRLGRMTNPSYSLGEAMKAAKKVYKKGKDVTAKAVKPFSKKRRSKRRNTRRKRRTRGRR